MNNPFLLHPRDLRTHWRELRRNLSSAINDHAQLEMVVAFWIKAPTGSRFMDYHNCATWPDPWTLIDSKDFDSNNISLGMFYTLLLADNNTWTPDRISLGMVRDLRRSVEALACIVDDRYMLGYEHGHITDMQDEPDAKIIQRYHYDPTIKKVLETQHTRLPSYHI